MNKGSKSNSFKKLIIALITIALFVSSIEVGLATSLEIRGTPYDTGSTTSENFSWDFKTFSGFAYPIRVPYGVLLATGGGERLQYVDNGQNPAIGSTNPTANVIDDGELIYSTRQVAAAYEVFDNENDVTKISFYHMLFLFGRPYCAVDNDATNLANIVLIQDPNDKITLREGETWWMSNGYSLSLNGVDVKGNKCWFSLNKDGKEIESGLISTDGTTDDKIFTADAEFGDNSEHVYFVTFVDSVFAGSNDNFVVFKYTWLVDKENPTVIEKDDEFGNFVVDQATESGIDMSNKETLTLTVDRDAKNFITDMWYFRLSDEGIGTNGGYVIYPAMMLPMSEAQAPPEQTPETEVLEEEIRSEEPIIVDMTETNLEKASELASEEPMPELTTENSHNVESQAMPGFGMPVTALCILSTLLLFRRRQS
ncbi:S-layer protein domain-containing protein [Methanococcoides methylutens]|uniref:S-layer protein domain-containing protein n=1 Tax=Methanococcoides methylutens TaxID=2226 RepID=UPI00404432CB